MRVVVFAVPFAVALFGCSNAESETPVDLKPGEYEIVFAGLNGVNGTKNHCFLAEEAATFPADPVTQFLPGGLRDSCQPHGDRKGNALSGTLTCKVQGTDTRAELALNWTGRMRPDGFDLQADGALKDLNAPKGVSPNQSRVTVTAKRTGECFS
jgi:hypothetical protein